jgi:hypothetical protein
MIVFVYSPGLSYFRISEVALSPYNVIREPAMFLAGSVRHICGPQVLFSTGTGSNDENGITD